jgi:membrane protein implicated in regulation of membrane protease activity
MGGDIADPETWRWIWLLVAGAFAAAEMFIAGTFFMLPFAAGALVAAVVAFAGGSAGLQWVLFLVVSVIGAVALIPLRRRLDADDRSDGVGSRRLIGEAAVVLEEIVSGPTGSGTVQIGRESWRAVSAGGAGHPVGATVRVVDVRGTSVVVEPS